MTVSQNGVGSVQVSWTPPSGEPAVTGYIIYYQQQDGGHTGSEMAGANATTATITGLIPVANYSITMMATSSMLPSTVTAAEIIIIGKCMGDKCMDLNQFNPQSQSSSPSPPLPPPLSWLETLSLSPALLLCLLE